MGRFLPPCLGTPLFDPQSIEKRGLSGRCEAPKTTEVIETLGRKSGERRRMTEIKKCQSMPPPNSLPGLLLTLTALSGEFPSSLICRLPSTRGYQSKVVKSLKRRGLLRSYYRNHLSGLRLTATAKEMLLNSCPDWFGPYLTGPVETNQVKSEITRRLRLHRMAEVLVTMLNAGAAVFPWEKPHVFSSAPSSDLSVDRPAYYSSREVKEMGPQSAMIRGSRATGVLLADGGVFTVYNTGPSRMRWEYNAETRFMALMLTELCQRRLSQQFMDAALSAVVMGADMGLLETVMGIGDGASHNHFVIDGSYDHFYFLTNDHRGEAVLRLLIDPTLRSGLDTILSEDLMPPDSGSPIENDAMDGSTPVLFGYTCDMPRLRRFEGALDIHGKSGLVVCFDFQEEALRRCLGPRVQLQCLDFEMCERTVFPSTKNEKS